MKQAKMHFSSEEEQKRYIAACEAEYLEDVASACARAQDGGHIITLCGPTCSGKTTTARILDAAFAARGKILHTVSIDDFYFDRAVLEARAKAKGVPLDYDSPSTIDLDLFGKVIADIEDGGTVTLPRFDFQTGKRVGSETVKMTDGDVFLFEGIQAVYPELTAYLAGHRYASLFISVEHSIACGDTVFSPEELRFMRRLVRDARTRGASAEFTFSLWNGVLENEKTHIYPNRGNIDQYIDSAMGYEVGVIKPQVLALLDTLPAGSVYWPEAVALRKKLKDVPVIDAKFVPADSVFREFIGE